jgi:hypothetical protein
MQTLYKNPSQTIDNLCIGSIIEVDGVNIVAELDKKIKDLTRIFEGNTYYIGQFGSIIKIHFGRRILYGYVSRLRMKSEITELGINSLDDKDARVIEFSLFGEGEWHNSNDIWKLKFERGISNFPLPLQKVYLTPSSELKQIFSSAEESTNLIRIGTYSGTANTSCLADLNELLGKHTAILGSTGSGKSGAVTVLLKSIIAKNKDFPSWHPRIVILDPHNEYSIAFKGISKTYSTDDDSLKLPYWLLNLDELSNLLLESNAPLQKNIIKDHLLKERISVAKQLKIDENRITVDSPIPFEISMLREAIVETRRPKNATDGKPYDSLISKIDMLCEDTRYNFLMKNWSSGKDDVTEIFSQFISNEAPVHIIDLSGIPNEVAGIVSSVIARTLFNFKVWETAAEREGNPILLVCEEAHRYVPNHGEAQYHAAQEAIKRIAKEGRKYGLSLMLVSQRPSELESTVLSQANSWLVLRLTNETDREYVKGILPDSLTGLTKSLSGLRKREAIFVGLAALIPSKILLNYLKEDERPKSNDIDFITGWQKPVYEDEQILQIINRWRLQTKEIDTPKETAATIIL